MRHAILIAAGFFLAAACTAPGAEKPATVRPATPTRSRIVTTNEAFTISSDRVVQSGKTAIAKNPRTLVSDYSGRERTVVLQKDLSALPSLSAPNFPLLVTLYNLALEEALLDIRPDNAFMAGKQWEGVWTRDISYAIHLALAQVLPVQSEVSLRAKVNKLPEVIQDTGTGGSWPISTDRVVWAIAAWELWLTTGNSEWLSYCYTTLKNTALRDRRVAFEPATGLYRGESSFLDWREQTYPSWMDGVDIFEAKALGTNALHQRLFAILAMMGKQLKADAAEIAQWEKWATDLKQAIDRQFWLEKEGFYTQFLYPWPIATPNDRSESLGEALTVLFGIAPPERAKTLVEKTPLVHFGVPCIYPQLPGPQPYHNKGIWPFVVAYYGWAGARTGNGTVVEHVHRSLTRAAALFMTHKENLVYDTGSFMGTAINSDRQLWSVAGYLALVQRLFFGIELAPEGLTFRPNLPASVSGPLTLSNFPYRKAQLTITLAGSGARIREMKVNGDVVPKDFRIKPDAVGHSLVEIILEGETEGKMNLAPTGVQTPSDPAVRFSVADNRFELRWRILKDASRFHVLRDGKTVEETTNSHFGAPLPREFSVYNIRSIAGNGLPSNPTKPLFIHPDSVYLEVQAETAVPAERLAAQHSGFSGKGYVMHDAKPEDVLRFPVTVEKPGRYLVRLRYANGNGPINTENKCATRYLTIGKRELGVLVMPQRGSWTSWGHSNGIQLELAAGKQEIAIGWDSGLANMNGRTDNAAIDRLELIRLP